MFKLKKIKTTTIKDFQNDGKDVEFSIFGEFDLDKLNWDCFFVCSHIGDKTTNDLCSIGGLNISSPFAKHIFDTKKKADDFLEDFKLKWELETNDITSYKREKSLNDLL
jgi:hypothetical protein